jgi:DNA-binding transcriptional LysR family regulator
MDRISAARTFITIVEQGSFVKAAEILNISRAAATRSVSEIENWTNAKILHRSTRRLSLTPAGVKMLEYCQQLIEMADKISNLSTTKDTAPRGTLRVSCSQYFAECAMLDVISRYRELYPEVNLELNISSRVVNLVEERIDLAIRISNALDPNLIARRFGDCPSTLCAAPSYIEQFGKPLRIEDLSERNCLVYSNFDTAKWNFTHQGERYSIAVSGDLKANETMFLLNAALKGFGIILQPTDAVAPYIESGELVRLLDQYEPESFAIQGVFLSRKNMPLAQRKLIEMLVDFYNKKNP